ncbi:MAG: Ig-like domain-containing protein [Puniceicoccales bacterium]|nr:Ig-like domain-containing protein [Puniceicoccales bacterium]
MKKKITIVATSILLVVGGIGATDTVQRPMAKITFVVKDDAGTPVPNIKVSMSTFHHWEPGEGFGKDIAKSYTSITDKNGVAVIQGRSLRGEFACGITATGYYPHRHMRHRFTERKSGRWEPWNPTLEIIIHPIINPIPMYMFHEKDKNIPSPEKEFGFDLKMDDFVAPYGRGVYPDFIFKIEEKIPRTEFGESYDYRLRITFPNKGDGIQSHFTTPCPKSESPGDSRITMPRYAPTTGYKNSLELRKALLDDRRIEQGMDQNYFFRVRTKLDKNGKITSALYGKISGPIEFGKNWFRLRYFLNPTPLDLNMENGSYERENLTPKPPKKP